MKRIAFFISLTLLLIFTTCTNNKDKVFIALQTHTGYSPFLPGRYILSPARDSLKYTGVPSSLKEYVVRQRHFQYRQFLWNQLKTGKITKEEFQKNLELFDIVIDTNKLCNTVIDESVLFLIGTDQDSNRVIIVDTDNDNDFSDENILKFKYPLERKKQIATYRDTLNIVTVTIDECINNKIAKKKIRLKVSPYKGGLGIYYNTDNDIEKKYHLLISYPFYKTANFKLNKTDYKIFIANRFTSLHYYPENTEIFFFQKGDSITTEREGNIPYRIGDIFNANGIDYLIDSITRSGDTLILKYLGKNVHPTGVTEGFYLPKFKAITLDYKEFNIKDYPDRYILFDFWGTWCEPCIKLIPELKQLHEDYKDKKFIIVSVAYDRDVDKVKEFTKKENMDWVHLFVSSNRDDKNSLVKKLKVRSFPTTILVEPNKKIIARNKSINEIRKILDERLNAL